MSDDHLTNLWLRDFVMDPAMRTATETELAATYAGTNYPRPTVDEVITGALATLAEDAMERAHTSADCTKIDHCGASAIVFRHLAHWLAPQLANGGGRHEG